MGEIRIRDLRTRAEGQLEDDFDVRDFHNAVLRSAGPLKIVEEEVDKYIGEKKKKQ